MTSMLELTGHLPHVEVAAGEVLCGEGDVSGSIWVLVSGTLTVSKGGEQINTIGQPGALIGEVAVLLGTGNTATVTAATACRLRRALDGAALLGSDAQVTMQVARGLAERLNIVSTYLADLKHQYTDAPGLAMAGEVLDSLLQRRDPPPRPGSRRDPDPEY